MPVETEKTPPDRGPVKRWARIRLWASYLYLLAAVIFAQPTLAWTVVGVILVLAGASVRLVSAATLVKDAKLCTVGIYSITRNPLYLGSGLVALGFAALASNLWFLFLAAFILVLLPLHIRMITLEENYLRDLFPAELPLYLKTVPSLIPRLWPPVKLSGTLDRDRLRKNDELAATLRIVVLTAILLAWHRSWLPG